MSQSTQKHILLQEVLAQVSSGEIALRPGITAVSIARARLSNPLPATPAPIVRGYNGDPFALRAAREQAVR